MPIKRASTFWLSLIAVLICMVVLYRLLWLPRFPISVVEQVPPDKIPVFKDLGDKRGLKKAVSASLAYLDGRRGDEQLAWTHHDFITVGALRKTLETFSQLLNENLDQEAFQEEIRRLFKVYRVTKGRDWRDSGGPVLVTGYFQPELAASSRPSREFSYPLYGNPSDLVSIQLNKFDSSLPNKTLWGRLSGQKLVPYYTRADIDLGRALKSGRVLAWLRSPVDGLMLHIQGSGILLFRDGKRKYIHYISNNGYPYRSIGKWLIDRGLLHKDQANWPGIHTWAQENPKKFKKALEVNPRYIFFKWEKKGPLGSLGKMLTPMRSVALDPTIYPPGVLCFLQAPLHLDKSIHRRARVFQGFVCNQDTGSAIKGPYRLDIYCGEGDKAGHLAGRLRAQGSVYLFLLKDSHK